jgi:hypothetical protein
VTTTTTTTTAATTTTTITTTAAAILTQQHCLCLHDNSSAALHSQSTFHTVILHIHFLIQFYKERTQGVGVYCAASLSKTPKTAIEKTQIL